MKACQIDGKNPLAARIAGVGLSAVDCVVQAVSDGFIDAALAGDFAVVGVALLLLGDFLVAGDGDEDIT